MRNVLDYISIILIVLLCNLGLKAQLKPGFEIASEYDDNVFLSPEKSADFLTDYELNLNFIPKDSNIVYSYSGDFISYLNTSERNLFLHDFGFNYYKVLNKSKGTNWYLGGDWLTRRNGEEYNYYNYNQWYLYSNIKFKLNNTYLKTGYNFRFRNYAYLPDLTNYQHYLFLQANRSFATRTSLIFETDLGYKSFHGTETYSTTYGGGRGRYAMLQPTITSKIPSMSHVVLLVRVAQSVFERVGIYAQYRKQISLTDETTYINSDSYYQDEELFDDPFSFESNAYSSRITVILPKTTKFIFGASLNNKNYISEQAYISDIDSIGVGGIRVDTKKSLYFNLSKTFVLKKKTTFLKTYVNYSYTINKSNSYWYNYDNNNFGLGISLNF
ncbi:MAG: hypothetical protein GXO79_02995 [Chlorobi bacterium]|nr:hypothetical protein [Chlorobiota bacterium]